MLKKLLAKYRQIPVGVKAALWFTVCNIAQKGISFITTPIFTRILTTEQYGEFTLYSSWQGIITIFATLNLFYGVYNNGMTKFSEDRPRFTSSLQGLSTVITLFVAAIYLCSMEFWNQLLGLSTLYMLTMFVELLAIPAFNFWSASQRYDYRYKGLIVASMTISLATPLLGYIAVINTEYKAEARVLSVALVQIVVGLIFYALNMMRGKTFFHKDYWKYALCFNLPLIPHYLSSVILNHSDHIMIGNMVGKSAAAQYSLAYTLAMVITVVTNAINASFTPFMYKSLKGKAYATFRKTANMLVLLVGTMSVLAMVVGPEFIAIIGPEEYRGAVWIIPPVAGSSFFIFLYPIFSNVEFYHDKTKYIMVASCAGAALNIALNYWLIPIFGFCAAGYTTLFCYIIYSFAHCVFARKLCKVYIGNQIFDMRHIMTVSAGVMIAILLIPLLYNYFVPRLLLGIIVLAAIGLLSTKYFRMTR